MVIIILTFLKLGYIRRDVSWLIDELIVVTVCLVGGALPVTGDQCVTLIAGAWQLQTNGKLPMWFRKLVSVMFLLVYWSIYK